jgi:hypothetical protein
MAADGQQDRLSGEEIFMILILSIVIPAMLLAINFDLSPQVEQQPYRSSPAEDIRSGVAEYESRQASPELRVLSTGEAEQVLPVPSRDQPLQQQMEATADSAQVAPEREGLRFSLMPIDFSLTGSGSPTAVPQAANEQMKISKSLLVNGEPVGNIEIYINSSGDPSIDVREFRNSSVQEKIKKFQMASRLPQKGLMKFTELREFGIDFRYSPTDDVIILNF